MSRGIAGAGFGVVHAHERHWQQRPSSRSYLHSTPYIYTVIDGGGATCYVSGMLIGHDDFSLRRLGHGGDPHPTVHAHATWSMGDVRLVCGAHKMRAIWSLFIPQCVDDGSTAPINGARRCRLGRDEGRRRVCGESEYRSTRERCARRHRALPCLPCSASGRRPLFLE